MEKLTFWGDIISILSYSAPIFIYLTEKCLMIQKQCYNEVARKPNIVHTITPIFKEGQND